MAEKFEEISQAIINIMLGKESGTERKELKQWLNSSESNQKWFDQLADDEWFERQLLRYNNINEEESEQIFWQTIRLYEKEKLKRRRRK